MRSKINADDAEQTPRARQKKYEARVSQAIAQGHFGRMLWAELARDYNATVANILHLWTQVDAHYVDDSASRHGS